MDTSFTEMTLELSPYLLARANSPTLENPQKANKKAARKSATS